MIAQDFILLIMNCKKYIKKALFQKQTWIQKLPPNIKYYHVIGDEALETEFKFDDEQNVLWVKTNDDYNSLPKKVYSAYKAVSETFQFKYIFKTDDDQILVNDKFFDTFSRLLTIKTPQIHYGGYVVDVKQPYLSEYYRIHPELPRHLPLYVTKYCSGRFYFLSKEATNSILKKKQKIYSEFLEDYAIGLNIDAVLKTNMLHIATNQFFTDIENSDFPQLIKDNRL
jgi:hypothetical protein